MSRPPNGGKQARYDLGGLVLFVTGLAAGLTVTLWLSQDKEPCRMVHESDSR